MESLFHLYSQKLWYCCGIIIIPHFKVFLWNHFFHLGSKMSAKLMMCGCPVPWEAWRSQTENMATVQERCLVMLDIWKVTLFSIEVCEFCKSRLNSLLLSWCRNGLKYKQYIMSESDILPSWRLLRAKAQGDLWMVLLVTVLLSANQPLILSSHWAPCLAEQLSSCRPLGFLGICLDL